MTLSQAPDPLRPVILRPQYATVASWGINHCGFCNTHLWTTLDTENHWKRGHFDRLINPGDADYPEALAAQTTLNRLAEP